jgi:hypothetical protein
MPNINKILNKVNQGKQAIKSLKGIQAKISGTGYDIKDMATKGIEGTAFGGVADKLAQQKLEAENTLNNRRASLQKSRESVKSKAYAKHSPEQSYRELQYPIGDGVENFLVFETLPRQKREGENNRNMLSGKESTNIYLYVPTEIGDDVKAEYSATGVGKGIRSALEIKDSFNGKMDGSTMQAMGTALENAIQTGIDSIASMIVGDASNFLAGRAVNPMEEQMFQGVGFRDFSFDYEFYPRNADEAKAVQDIVHHFKTAMLPDTYSNAEGDTAVENYFNYPNIFKLSWEGPIAKQFDDFLPMVCTSVSTSHSTKLFQDGYPVSTTMGISFTEIKILTQENYQQISKSSKADKSIGSGNTSLAMRRSETIAATNASGDGG